MSDKKVAAIQRRHDTWTQEFQVRGCATEALLGFQDYCLAHDDREYLLAELTRLRAENESLRADLDQALKANDMSIEDCMALRFELESLKERLRGLPRRCIVAVPCGSGTVLARDMKESDEEWIRAADLEKVLGDG